MRPRRLPRGASHLRYEMLSDDAWALTALSTFGRVYLGWLAVQTFRGRIRLALESDRRGIVGS